MSTDNGHDDDETPEPASFGHPDNRPFLAVLGNFVLEAQEHNRRIDGLYQELRVLDRPAGKLYEEKVLGELERHHHADGEHLAAMTSVVRGGATP